MSKKKKSPVKRLQHTIEDQVGLNILLEVFQVMLTCETWQVYRILRNSRVLTNNAVNCLFSVPPNQAFVHIMAEPEEIQVVLFYPIRLFALQWISFVWIRSQSSDSTAAMFQLLRASFKRHRDPHSTSRAKQLLLNTPTHWQEDYAMDEDEISEDYP